MNETATGRLSARVPILKGALTIFVFFAVFGGWSALADLSSAAIAPGEVAVDSNRKTIQHLEGGIVEAILVEEGASVSAGDLLIRLSDTQPRALLYQLRSRLAALQAREARLLAERDGLEAVAFPDDLGALSEAADINQVLRGEQNIFAARRESHENHKAILRQRISQLEKEIDGLSGEAAAAEEQLVFLDDEIASMEGLHEKKLVGKSRLRELQREAADMTGEKSRSLALIARARQNIAEQELQILELRAQRSEELEADLRETQAQKYELQERLLAAGDVLARTDIVAPISGKVVGLQVHTVGGVIGSREPLMDIVPDEDRLVINARVSPTDIDVVREGLDAKVRLLAYNQRDAAPIDGIVRTVSADRFEDERTGQPYYLAKVSLPEASSEGLGKYRIQPGMQAEVMVLTGRRTALSYLLEPLSRTFRRSFRES